MLFNVNGVGQRKPTCPNRGIVKWRHLFSVVPAALGFISMVFGAKPLFAMVTTVEISPLVTKSTLLGSTDVNRDISVVLALPLSDKTGADSFIQHLTKPGDPLYHRYLTPAEFAARFGASPADYAAIKAWATGSGLSITQESVARTTLTVRGKVAQMQAIFNTKINDYRSPDGKAFYSASVPPTIPSEISGKLSAMIGLTSSKQYAPLFKVGKMLGEAPVLKDVDKTSDTAGGTGPGGSYSAADLRTAYTIPSWGSYDENAVVAVFEQGGFSSTDVTTYLKWNRLPSRKVTPIGVNGSPTTVDDPGVEAEAVLDIDMILAINPEVAEVRVYEDSIDQFPVALLDALTAVADDNNAEILSISYGQDEGLQGTGAMEAENTVLEQLAGEGITVVASSGDSGAYGDGYNDPYNVSDPASQPMVTGVGGTSLFTGANEAYGFESVWNDLGVGLGASGGGISSYWPIPSWQYADVASNYMTQNGGSATYRNVPDVAAVGDPATGVGIYSKINGGWTQIGGTSVAAPIWAGYLSLINAGYKYAGFSQVGFFNPVLYSLGIPFFGYAVPSNILYGVNQGSNGDAYLYPGAPGFTAAPGYVNATGNGSISGCSVAAQLMISQFKAGTPPGPMVNVVGKVTGTTLKLTWYPVVGASAYCVMLTYPGTVFNVANSYLTKETKMTFKNLIPNYGGYTAVLFAVNPSGFNYTAVPFVTGKLAERLQ